MLNFLKYIFFGGTGLLINIVLYGVFGAFVAFFALVYTGASPREVSFTSPKLASFVDSGQTSAVFTAQELGEGVFYMIISAAKEQSKADKKGVAAPDAPSVSFAGKAVEVCVPFSVRILSKNLTLYATVGLSFDGNGVKVISARVGDARLPPFAASKLGKSLLEFYASLKPLNKYIEAFGKMKIEVDGASATLTK